MQEVFLLPTLQPHCQTVSRERERERERGGGGEREREIDITLSQLAYYSNIDFYIVNVYKTLCKIIGVPSDVNRFSSTKSKLIANNIKWLFNNIHKWRN